MHGLPAQSIDNNQPICIFGSNCFHHLLHYLSVGLSVYMAGFIKEVKTQLSVGYSLVPTGKERPVHRAYPIAFQHLPTDSSPLKVDET